MDPWLTIETIVTKLLLKQAISLSPHENDIPITAIDTKHTGLEVIKLFHAQLN